jgi:hypothetical protein
MKWMCFSRKISVVFIPSMVLEPSRGLPSTLSRNIGLSVVGVLVLCKQSILMQDRIWHRSAGPLDAVNRSGLADALIIPLRDKNVDAPHPPERPARVTYIG